MGKILQTISPRKSPLILMGVLLGLGGLALFFSSHNVSATGGVFHVRPTSCSNSGSGTEDEPCGGRQQAVKAASSNDTIIVHNGTYTYSDESQCNGDSECVG